MKNAIRFVLLFCFVLSSYPGLAQETSSKEKYSYKKGTADGIGKWYMGREIAHVMGFQGMGWLERPEREKEENTSRLLQNMNIRPGDTIADIGAGSGYHVFQMAKIASEGHLYAVDIQDEMLEAIQQKKENTGITNITAVKGGEQEINLAENSLDKVLIVDVYHELSYPIEMLSAIKKALKEDGKLYLIEYRSEDDTVPIKKLHKMSEAQAVNELKVLGFKLEKNIGNLPWQHCMVFVKE